MLSKGIIATFAIAGLSTLASIAPALAGEYGSSRLSSQRTVTWVFNDAASRGNIREGALVGYACVVDNSLAAISRPSEVARYELRVAEFSTALVPYNAMLVSNNNGRFRASGYEMPDVEVERIWQEAETDDMGDWFRVNTSTDELGRACVDGGMAGVIQHLERQHNITIIPSTDD